MTSEKLKQIAIAMAAEKGLENLSRNTVSAKAGIPAGSFAHVAGMSFKAFIRMLAEEGHGGAEKITKRRVDPDLRRGHIVASALSLVQERCSMEFTRGDVAEAAGVSESTISKYFATMPQLHRAVKRKARQDGVEAVVAGLL